MAELNGTLGTDIPYTEISGVAATNTFQDLLAEENLTIQYDSVNRGVAPSFGDIVFRGGDSSTGVGDQVTDTTPITSFTGLILGLGDVTPAIVSASWDRLVLNTDITLTRGSVTILFEATSLRIEGGRQFLEITNVRPTGATNAVDITGAGAMSIEFQAAAVFDTSGIVVNPSDPFVATDALTAQDAIIYSNFLTISGDTSTNTLLNFDNVVFNIMYENPSAVISEEWTGRTVLTDVQFIKRTNGFIQLPSDLNRNTWVPVINGLEIINPGFDTALFIFQTNAIDVTNTDVRLNGLNFTGNVTSNLRTALQFFNFSPGASLSTGGFNGGPTGISDVGWSIRATHVGPADIGNVTSNLAGGFSNMPTFYSILWAPNLVDHNTPPTQPGFTNRAILNNGSASLWLVEPNVGSNSTRFLSTNRTDTATLEVTTNNPTEARAYQANNPRFVDIGTTTTATVALTEGYKVRYTGAIDNVAHANAGITGSTVVPVVDQSSTDFLMTGASPGYLVLNQALVMTSPSTPTVFNPNTNNFIINQGNWQSDVNRITRSFVNDVTYSTALPGTPNPALVTAQGVIAEELIEASSVSQYLNGRSSANAPVVVNDFADIYPVIRRFYYDGNPKGAFPLSATGGTLKFDRGVNIGTAVTLGYTAQSIDFPVTNNEPILTTPENGISVFDFDGVGVNWNNVELPNDITILGGSHSNLGDLTQRTWVAQGSISIILDEAGTPVFDIRQLVGNVTVASGGSVTIRNSGNGNVTITGGLPAGVTTATTGAFPGTFTVPQEINVGGLPEDAIVSVYSVDSSNVKTLQGFRNFATRNTAIEVPANQLLLFVSQHPLREPLVTENAGLSDGASLTVDYGGWSIDSLIPSFTQANPLTAFPNYNAGDADISVTTAGITGDNGNRTFQLNLWGLVRATTTHRDAIVNEWATGDTYADLDVRLIVDGATQNLRVGPNFRIGPRVGSQDQQYNIVARNGSVDTRIFVPVIIRGRLVERFTAVGTVNAGATSVFPLLDSDGAAVPIASIDTVPSSDVGYEFLLADEVSARAGLGTNANPIVFNTGDGNASVNVADLAVLEPTAVLGDAQFTNARPIVITTPRIAGGTPTDNVGSLDGSFLEQGIIDYSRFSSGVDDSVTGQRVGLMAGDNLLGIRPTTHNPTT